MQNIYTESKIYFLLHIDPYSGLGDRLNYWRIYYDICRSMGWNYIHQPLDTKRSDHNNNIFDFLGFNEALSELFPADEKIREAKIIYIPLMSRDELGSLSSKDAQNIIMCMVRQQLYRNRLKLLLPWISKTGERRRTGSSAIVVHISPYNGKVNAILHRLLLRSNHTRTPTRENLPQNWLTKFREASTSYALLIPYLRRAYEEARIKHPYPSKFKSGKIKILIHVREGDRGVIRTPWQQWIVRGQALDSLRDFKGQFPLLAIEEYLPIIKQVLQWLDPNDSSILTLSDGYKRPFSDIYHRQEKYPFLSKDQLRELRDIEDTYEERVFKPFSEISDTTIGENYDNLRHLDQCLHGSRYHH